MGHVEGNIGDRKGHREGSHKKSREIGGKSGERKKELNLVSQGLGGYRCLVLAIPI